MVKQGLEQEDCIKIPSKTLDAIDKIQSRQYKLQKAPFRKIVKEVAQNELKRLGTKHGVMLSKDAVLLLQQVVENDIVRIFSGGRLIAVQSERIGVQEKDLYLSEFFDQPHSEPILDVNGIRIKKKKKIKYVRKL